MVCLTSSSFTLLGDFIVTSTLTINNLHAVDAGDVSCVVMADGRDFPDAVNLQTDSASSVLTVLGRSHDLMTSHSRTSNPN